MGAKEREICDQDGHEWEEWDDMLSGDLHISCLRCGAIAFVRAFSEAEEQRLRAAFEELERAYRSGNLPV